MNDEAAPRALIQFRLLGQVEARRDGERVELGGRKQRAALASLLVRAGRVVSLDQIVDDLWPEHPPARAAATVQVFVSNLRRAVEPDRPRGAPGTVLVTASRGYQLAVEPGMCRSALTPRPRCHTPRRAITPVVQGATVAVVV